MNLSAQNQSSVSCLTDSPLTLGERKIYRKGWMYCTRILNLDLPATGSVNKFASQVFLCENERVIFGDLLKVSESITFIKTVWIAYCIKVITMNGYFAMQAITSFLSILLVWSLKRMCFLLYCIMLYKKF